MKEESSQILKNKQLVPVENNKNIVFTADGSISYYSSKFKEAYHAKSFGAYSESLYKHIKPSNILELGKKQDVRVLDICLGLGYNLGVLIDEAIRMNIKNKIHIVSLEIDFSLIPLIQNNIFTATKGYETLKQLLNGKNHSHKNISLELIMGDALKVLPLLSGEFDAIFFDPFSKSKTSKFWEVDTIQQLYRLLGDNGVSTTYSVAKTFRSSLEQVGFQWDSQKNINSYKTNKINKINKMNGTIFYK